MQSKAFFWEKSNLIVHKRKLLWEDYLEAQKFLLKFH